MVSTPDRSEQQTEQPPNQTPEPDEHARAAAKEMAKAYEDRPTAVLPGSDGTVTGTAINEWLDDDGNPIYGNDNNSGASEDG